MFRSQLYCQTARREALRVETIYLCTVRDALSPELALSPASLSRASQHFDAVTLVFREEIARNGSVISDSGSPVVSSSGMVHLPVPCSPLVEDHINQCLPSSSSFGEDVFGDVDRQVSSPSFHSVKVVASSLDRFRPPWRERIGFSNQLHVAVFDTVVDHFT